ARRNWWKSRRRGSFWIRSRFLARSASKDVLARLALRAKHSLQAKWLMPAEIWLFPAFLIGAIIGSFLNVCIARLPLEKSLLWPKGSRCGGCYRPIRWRDKIPLLSYWLL